MNEIDFILVRNFGPDELRLYEVKAESEEKAQEMFKTLRGGEHAQAHTAQCTVSEAIRLLPLAECKVLFEDAYTHQQLQRYLPALQQS